MLCPSLPLTTIDVHSTSVLLPPVLLPVVPTPCPSTPCHAPPRPPQAVASFVTEEDRARGAVFPSLSKSRELAAHVTRKVAEIAYKDGVASNLPRPVNLLEYAKLVMYDTRYR